MSDCTHDCSSCKSASCSDRKTDLRAPANALSRIGKVIAVVSGKGGVGKSLVTQMLAVAAARSGKRVAILDADITGPSVPKAFGVTQKAESDGVSIQPAVTQTGIRLMSVNMMLDDETQPVVWRGPVISGVVKQFWTDVAWGETDYMFVDMPPGTGDVPLTVFQSLPVAGIVVVTTPQELVSMIVHKAVHMARMMHVPVLGLVENMSYFACPDCGKRIEVFGKSRLRETAQTFGIDATARIPLDPQYAQLSDAGQIEQISCAAMRDLWDMVR